MKTVFKTIALLSVLALAASCQQFKIDTQMTPEKAAASLRLVCDALDSYTVPAENPGTVSFSVSANTPWTISRSNGADWCTVTPSSSASSSLITDVVVSFAANKTAEDRSATLTLRGEGIHKTHIITITQTRQGRLFVTPIPQDYAACGGPLNFTINTNNAWQIRSSESWLQFNREEGQPDPDGRTITIIATADPSQVLERNATVTVIAGDDEESFEVTQKAVFELAEIGDDFPAAGGAQVLRLRTDLPWSVSSDKSWISFDADQGTGDGKALVITATAGANEGAVRKANITVTAGDSHRTFEISQKGAAFDIVAPASTVLDSKGEELLLEVDATIAWEPSTSVADWTVEKVDDKHFKLKAAWNGKLIEKKGLIEINGTGGAHSELEFTQGVNFTTSGHCEILADGSVKVYEDVVSGIVTKENFQYIIMDVDVEMHLGNKGSFTMCTEHYSDGYEYELQFNLNRTDAFRLRSNGGKLSVRGAKEFTFDLTKANAMTHGQIQFIPDADDPAMINQSFYWNGEKQDAVNVSTSVFAVDPTLSGTYFVGSIVAVADDSYFIIKSCTITPVE